MKERFKLAWALLLAITLLSNNIACFATGSSVSSILSPTAYDIAQQLAVMPLLEQLYALQSEQDKDLPKAITRLELKQKLTEKIFIANLQVRDVAARIDKEIVHLDRTQGYLQDRRDKALKLNTLSNAVGIGIISEVGQVGEMRRNEIPGEITEVAGIGVSIILSALSFYLQGGKKVKVPTKPNMLSQAFNYRPDKDGEYPTLIWNYLNRVPPGDKSNQTRLESLFKHWQKYEIIGGEKSLKQAKRAAMLSNNHPSHMANIDLLDDQIDLLSDLKVEIYQLDRDLLELLQNVQAL